MISFFLILRRIMLSGAFLVVCHSPAFAESIVLKSGKVIEGKIVERNDQFIKVDQGLGVDLTYYWDDIVSQENSVPAAPVSVSKDFKAERLSVDDFFKLRSMFENKRFAELDAEFRLLQRTFEDNHLSEYMLFDALNIFLSGRGDDKSLFEEWKKLMPESFVPYLGEAKYYLDLGWRARGQRWASETTDAQMQMMHSNFGLSLEAVQKVLDISPRVLPAYHIAFNIYTTLGDDAAGELIGAALAIAPESYAMRRLIIYRMTPRWGGSYELMEEFAKDADQYADKNPYLKMLRGFIYNDMGSLLMTGSDSGSKKIATVLSNAVPLLSPVINNVVDQMEKSSEYTAEELENVKKALRLFDRALEFGENVDFYNSRASAYRILGDHAARLRDAQRAVELAPTHSDAYAACAEAHFDLGNYEQSLKYADLADRLDFNSEDLKKWREWAAKSILAKGYKDYEAKNYEVALAKMNMALRFNPRSETTYYWRGRVYLFQEQYDRAIHEFLQAIEIRPDYYEPYPNLVYIFVKQRNFEQGLIYANKALEINSSDGKVLYDRAHLNHFSGRKKEADADLKRSCDVGYAQACQKLGR